jgi:Pyruvate/2-oxoacid:ferredoxin oxidoreductase delta subunit
MKINLKVTKEVEVKTLKVKAEVSHWDDSVVNELNDSENGDNIPCKVGDLWCPEIDIDSGIITNWEAGKTAEIHYKVCDGCGWELLDDKGEVVLSEDDGYVPDTLCPKENGFGDYIIMDIASHGKIQDWNFKMHDFASED